MGRLPRKDGLFEPNLFLQSFLTLQPLTRLVERAIQPSGMGAGDYAVLSAIDELEPIKPSDVSRLTGVPRPTLTAVIERLSGQGLIERAPNPRDGRSYQLTLTAAGRAIKRENGCRLGAALATLEPHLQDGSADVIATLAQLRVALEATLDEWQGSPAECASEGNDE